LKILQVIPYYYPAWKFGGPVKVAYDISKELVERGHSVTVYTSDIVDEKTRVENSFQNIDGVDVFYFRNLSLYAAMRKMFVTPSMLSAVKDNIKSFDVVHVHGNRTTQSPVLHYFLKKNSVPYIVQAHGGLPRVSGGTLNRLYDFFFGYNLLRDASKVIALSKVEVEQYVAMGVPKEKTVIIPNGIDLSDYANLPYKGFFKKFGISDDEKIVLYLGRINKIKGVDILAKAFAKITKQLVNVRLVFVGPDDGFRSELEALIKALNIEDKVLITGPLYGKDKLKAYVDADVYVLPSRYETFPMTVLECVACGTPVILTAKCGISDFFRDNVGLVVNPDPNHLSEALLEILLDLGKQNSFRENCNPVIDRFNISKTVSKLEDVYEEIAMNFYHCIP
jgi:glycosyltransferase involved in cell wall biosynthesis